MLIMALMALVFGVLIAGSGLGSAAPGPSVAEYSQCANDKAGSTAETPNPLDCVPAGWINGILNANNSQYREDQVTAQRLFVDGLVGTDHSYTFRYLILKGQGHAYDSLATWDYTQADANPCQGLKGPSLQNCNTAVLGTPSTLDIDPDPLNVSTSCTTGSASTQNHQLTGQVFTMYGGTLDSMSYGQQSTDSEGTYQSVTVNFTTANNPGRVYFLFGGHLAAGGTPATGSIRGWGANCGASAISGGPYHIKLDLIDGASAGNRDNQIMSNAVLPFFSPSASTTPTATATFSATFDDKLTLSGTNGSPTGNVTFRLYDSKANCDLHGTTVGSGGLVYSNVTSVKLPDTQTTDSGTVTGSKTVTGQTATIDYYWWVTYPGDSGNAPVESDCVEHSQVTAPGITNTNDPSS